MSQRSIELGDDAGSQMEFGGQELVNLSALRILITNAAELPWFREPNPLIGQDALIVRMLPCPTPMAWPHGRPDSVCCA